MEWARFRLAADIEMAERCFEPSLFELELAGLLGRFAPSYGSVLVGLDEAAPRAA